MSSEAADELGLELGDPIRDDGQLYRLRGILESEQGFGPGGGNELVVPISALSEQEYFDTSSRCSVSVRSRWSWPTSPSSTSC